MRHVAAAAFPAAANASDRTGHLIAASGVVSGDRVLVFGYEILDHLTGLARHGVASAAGVHAGYLYRPHEPADVVWFTSVADIEAEVGRLLLGIGNPRLVAIELVEPVAFGALRRLLRALQARGLRHTDYYKAPGLFVVTAWRADRHRTRS
jgi:hypothetical protein